MFKNILIKTIIFTLFFSAATLDVYGDEELNSIMPEGDTFKEKDSPFKYREVYKKGSLIGYSFHTKDLMPVKEGYNGSMDIIVGINKDGAIENLNILEHSETPEYAEAITGRKFLDQFKGKSIEDNFKIGDDIDAVTRATVSSQAVSDILRGSINKLMDAVGSGSGRSQKIKNELKRSGLNPREAEYYEIIND
ncbi:FMN-binding protein [Candidatus Omnitrophota bacterium]